MTMAPQLRAMEGFDAYNRANLVEFTGSRGCTEEPNVRHLFYLPHGVRNCLELS